MSDSERAKTGEAALEFCAICGLPRGGHPPAPPPGPPSPPPQRRAPDEVWRPRHEFKPSGLTFIEVLKERDSQIAHWRERAYAAERKIKRAQEALADV